MNNLEILDLANDTAREVSIYLLRHWRSIGNAYYISPTTKSTTKNYLDFSTKTDDGAQSMAVARISENQLTRGDLVCAEEGTLSLIPESEQPVWYIDPIDGTINYFIGNPFFAFSLGRTLKGRAELGVVAFPALNFMLYGGEGIEAYYEVLFGEGAGSRRSLRGWRETIDAQHITLKDSPAVIHLNSINRTKEIQSLVVPVAEDVAMPEAYGCDVLGIAAVALGWSAGYVAGPHREWDYAGMAGVFKGLPDARITTLSGKQHNFVPGGDRSVLAAINPDVHEQLLKQLNK